MRSSSGNGSSTASRMWPTVASERMMTGLRKRSARLKASTVSEKHSATELGTRAMMECSPWVPQRACMTSPCEGSVGSPVEGPPRMTSTMTQGICAMAA